MSQLAVVAPPTTPAQGEWTYEDFLKLPDDGRRYEVIEGVLYVANAPNADHHFVVTEASRLIGNFVIERQLGRVLVAPFEVHLAERSRPVQPDLLFVRAERWPKGQVAFFDGAPDLIVEIVSLSSVRTDRVVKFTAYENAGVPEYWIANPHTRTVEVYTLSNGEYALLGEYTGDEHLQSLLLAGIDIVTSTLFG
ncbi:MAG: Uma2 family endonuclease [Chloroflexi bacterium]|nr:MAG: Uma2 family endonuclease [Chloroflexota bacterium]